MMDILTVPLLSVFVLPTLSYYSTRINIIFFYVTWTTLVLSHSALRVELFGTVAVRLLFYLIPSILLYLFDVALPSTSVVIKEQGEAGLPTGSKRGRVRLKELKIVGWALANFVLGILAQAAFETFLMRVAKMRPAVQVSLNVPMPWDVSKDLLLGLLCREIITYSTHRYILHSNIFTLPTNLHRTWYHSLRSPFPLTATYDHPLAYVLSSFIPMYAPVLLLHFHMLTFLVYLVVVSVEETLAYSGYSVMPTGLFLHGIARRTERHLAAKGRGNFGRWGIFDFIGGLVDEEDGAGAGAGQRGHEDGYGDGGKGRKRWGALDSH